MRDSFLINDVIVHCLLNPQVDNQNIEGNASESNMKIVISVVPGPNNKLLGIVNKIL